MADPRVWLIGESNPYQASVEEGQRYALYPEPAESAGGRLCNLILGMHKLDYLRAFERRNLCHQKWSVPVARASAACLSWKFGTGDVVLLFGRKVWEACFPLPSNYPLSAWAAAPPFANVSALRRVVYRAASPVRAESLLETSTPSYSVVRIAVASAAPHLAPLLGRAPTTRGRTAAEREVARVG